MSQEGELSFNEAIQKAGDSITRFPLVPVRGIPLMTYITENWDSIWAFCPDPSDLLIATYPKAGTQTFLHFQITNLVLCFGLALFISVNKTQFW